ncbi:MAG: DUF4915 domain-containing protein [Solirubrobacterales bacterium]
MASPGTSRPTGEFGWADLAARRFVPVAFCSGYLRGLSFREGIAFIGLSLPKNQTFSGLPLADRLEDAGMAPQCGILAIDIETGEVVSSLTFTSGITELYDVAVIEAFRAPIALTPGEPAANTTINIGPMVDLASQS